MRSTPRWRACDAQYGCQCAGLRGPPARSIAASGPSGHPVMEHRPLFHIVHPLSAGTPIDGTGIDATGIDVGGIDVGGAPAGSSSLDAS